MSTFYFYVHQKYEEYALIYVINFPNKSIFIFKIVLHLFDSKLN